MPQPIAQKRHSKHMSGRSKACWLQCILAMGVTVLMPLKQVMGQQVVWGNSGVGSFYVGSNWVGLNVPNSNNSILINNGGTVYSTNTADVTDATIDGGSTYEVRAGVLSYFTPDFVYLGTSGTGTLTIGSQAMVAAANNIYLGYASGATGVVSMDGGYLSPYTTYVGYAGNGTMTMVNGSTLQSTTGYVGYQAGSQGLVSLNNSTWKAEISGSPQDITVGHEGRGEIQAVNSRISALNFVIGSNSTSTGIVAANGGNITIQNGLEAGKAGTGNLSLTNGASLTSYGVNVATSADSTGFVSISNSTLTSSANIFVGLGGNGTLETDGAVIHAPELFVGRQSGSTGVANLFGGNMTLTGELHVGAEGAGSFTLDGGGALHTDKGNMGFASGASGVINVLDGNWTNKQAVFVGVSGIGTLNVGADGAIDSESGYISQNLAGSGTVNITGGSWTMSNTLAVGVNGTASFSASAGGEVSSRWSQLGLHAGSSGNVTLNNASWTTLRTLTIGENGNGYFSAENGSNVTAGIIELGETGGVSGLLHVVDSTLTTENIGQGGGTGSVFFSNTQLKLLGGSGVLDTLLIFGFAPGAVVVGSGGLTVDTQGGNAQITTVLSGNGSLTKTGAGRLRLTAANTFSGGTSVQGGVLEIVGNDALATGNVEIGTAELRASSNATISGNLGSGIQLVSVSANQTGTFSAAAGETLTLAPLDFLLVAGSTMQVGSAGNTGTVIFAPTGAIALPTDVGISVDYGTFQAGNGALIAMADIAGSVTVATGATLDFNDQVTGGAIENLRGNGTVRIGSLGNSTLAVNSGNFSGNFLGTGNLLKQTPGTLVLSGDTILTGSTTIQGGTLQVEGSLGNGYVEVQSGAILGGSGEVVEVLLQDGGILAPGSSAGTLTVGEVFWYAGGEMRFELGTSSDLLVAGALQGFDAPGEHYWFTFENRGWSEGTYDLIQVDAAYTDIDASEFRFTNSGGFAGTFAYNNNVLQFTLQTIPEPSTCALLVIAGALAIRRRRRISNTRS
jgi:autotransporter-associated beta strand protein/T5SS/PEP-CTERM-associated repeat protein